MMKMYGLPKLESVYLLTLPKRMYVPTAAYGNDVFTDTP